MNMTTEIKRLYRVYHIAPGHITEKEQAQGVKQGKPTVYQTGQMTYDRAVAQCEQMKERAPSLHAWVDVA